MSPAAAKDVSKHALNWQLYDALLKEDSEKVKELCAQVDEGGLHMMTIHDDTVLHMATYSKQPNLVLSLLDTLPERHLDKMTRQNHSGNTILHEAATSNQALNVAKKLLEKAPGLLCMRNYLGETAVFRTARYGKKEMFNFLAGKIIGYKEASQQVFLQRSDKTTVLHISILAQHFELALLIAKKFEHLVGEKDADGMTGLQLLSCNSGAFQRDAKREVLLKQITSYVKLYCSSNRQDKAQEQKQRYESTLELAKFLIKKDTSWDATYPGIDQSKRSLHKYGHTPSVVEKGSREGTTVGSLGQGEGETNTPLFLATKSGCIEIVEEILKLYPQAVEHIDDEGRNILHIAIKYRQLKIFELVRRKEVPMKRLVRKIDNEGNSILHTAGIKMTDYVPEKMQGPAIELQEELLWFERVKEVIVPHFLNHRNHMKLTAEGLFAQTNNELRKISIEWLKSTSEGCTIVAVLIATVAFAAAYTVPGGPNADTGFPVLQHHPFFVVFTVTDVLSLSFALTSVVIFLSILTSAFRLEDFKHSLPNKLMLGFTFLFLSVSMMMVSFGVTVLLMISRGERWTKVILYALSFLPVGIFALSYFPLYLSLSTTYKYLLKKARKAIPWSNCVLVPSGLTKLFNYCQTQTTNSSNILRPQCTNSTKHNEEIEDFCSQATLRTSNFNV